jgi:general L-amino acid transport system permease protein
MKGRNGIAGVTIWVRQELFRSWWSSVITIALLYVAFVVADALLDWAIVNAVWQGEDRQACLVPGQGACWPFVEAKFGQFIYGRYPEHLRWRPDLVFLLGLAGLLWLGIPGLGKKAGALLFLFTIYPPFAAIILAGGLGLEPVSTSLWGGLLVTLVVAMSGIIASLPLGILLALGRRSHLPVLRIMSVGFIEFWRGIPLITVLFMASVMLPLFFPENVDIDKLLRALIGVALFSAAYMAEVVRGGLNAVAPGQYEAAKALGLGATRMMALVILPQALRYVIPGIVNNFIGLFKDTTLVLIIGLFDLLGIIQLHLTDPTWAAPQTAATGYVFAAVVFWLFCFAMSRYAHFMERRLAAGTKR